MIRVNGRLLSLYVFSLFIMYLAGVYFGAVLFTLFLVFALLPILSLVSFVWWISGVRVFQKLDRHSPVKGDSAELQVMVENHSILPVPQIRFSFVGVSDALTTTLSDFDAYLPPLGTLHPKYRVAFPYRGTYQIGLSELVIHDQMRFIQFRKRVTPITVTVYPRILNISRFAPVAHDIEGSGRYSSAGILPDTTLFHQLKEYRDGDSIRHIFWKKYASTGKPYLKEYERTKRAGIRIYFDTRPSEFRRGNGLEREDAAVEALVAIVRYLLVRRVHTTVVAGTNPLYLFSGEDMASFQGFYRSTEHLVFGGRVSPGSLFQTDHVAGLLDSQTCIFITHNLDSRLVTISDGAATYETILLLNRAGTDPRHHAAFRTFVGDASRRGKSVIVLKSSSSIMEDLTGHRLAFADRTAGPAPTEVSRGE